jgi:hypothetical protein
VRRRGREFERDVHDTLGHANLNTTQRYLEPSSNAKRKLVELIWRDQACCAVVNEVVSGLTLFARRPHHGERGAEWMDWMPDWEDFDHIRHIDILKADLERWEATAGCGRPGSGRCRA